MNSCISSNTNISNSLRYELRIVHDFILVCEINMLELAPIAQYTIQLYFGSTNFTTAEKN